jgi:hypothetical protein
MNNKRKSSNDMKTKFYFFVFALMTHIISANAKPWTVSNDPNKPAQYPDVQSAVNAVF